MVHVSSALLLTAAIYLAASWPGSEGADQHHDWSYGTHNGPHQWTGMCSSGRFQSPIDLAKSVAHPRYFEPLVFFQYDMPANVTIKNNGHTMTLTLQQPCTEQLAGGGLPGAYALAQVHFHWESEHTVEQRRFPLEAHFVHYNRKRFNSVKDAVGHDDGLAVLGVLFQVSSEANPTLAQVLSGVPSVTQEGGEVLLPTALHLEKLLPKDTENFFRYRGSLTTPGCNEGVLWTVLRSYVSISKEQVAQFKKLNSRSGRLDINFRPVQPLNERNLYYRVENSASAATPGTAMALCVLLLVAARSVLRC